MYLDNVSIRDMRKRIFTTCVFVFLTHLSVWAVPDGSPQERYIEKYAGLAVEEMYRSGIPASITLAQGMLESGNGLSDLAVRGNNHFGIKCHNGWTGKTIRYDDERRNECFRRYSSPEESFRDHSDFLRYRDRYSFLFDYRVTDYRSWAYGLRKAGYATDPSYPKKLIKIIEDYRLYEYDSQRPGAARRNRRDNHDEEAPAASTVPAPPSSMDEVVPLSDVRSGHFQFPLTRQVYTKNGVPFVYAVEGDTYESLASYYGLFPREILKFNDLWSSEGLQPGTVVYLRAKKGKAAKGLDKHVIEEGETMRGIAQRYAVKLSKLYKLNGFEEGYVPKEGDIIRLRK